MGNDKKKYLPRYGFIVDRTKHHENRDSIEETISYKRPPVQFGNGCCTETAYGYNEHNIENGATDDSTDLKQ